MKILVLLFLVYSSYCSSQELKMYSSEEIGKLHTKPLVIHIYTDWCTVCGVENYRIIKNKPLVKLLNENYYMIKVEAEKTKNDIFFQVKKYSFVSNGTSGLHEFAQAFSRNKLQPIYPIWIIIGTDGHLLHYQEGSFRKGEMEIVLKNLMQNKK
ncbi:thiol:disulfide interchange protein [Chryseobacterium sp.]|uniref:thiol:disulfide interchange protein n=1 Tax=Chryseobacterium sp. TaxID=1871047 RepID=UPI00388DFCEF